MCHSASFFFNHSIKSLISSGPAVVSVCSGIDLTLMNVLQLYKDVCKIFGLLRSLS